MSIIAVDTFVVSENEVVIFTHCECDGMVGETNYYTQAHKLNAATGKLEHLKYDEVLQELEKVINSGLHKEDLENYKKAMFPMSPRGLEIERIRVSSEIKAIVE
jgi:hypothetical protein